MAIDLSTFHGPADCREALERSGSLLLTGRSSMESGKIAYRAAVQDLLQAGGILEQKTGLQGASVLPARDVLETMLRGAPAIASVAGDGRRFTNRYLQWSDHPRGIHVLVSAGSGRKVDENLLQPALARTAEVIRALQPGLIGDRITYLDRAAALMGSAAREHARVVSIRDRWTPPFPAASPTTLAPARRAIGLVS